MSVDEVPRGLPISITIEGNCLIVRLSGEIDMGNAEALPAILAAAASESDAKIVVDIADVEFVDSSFLKAILLCQQTLGEDVAISVRNASDQARRVFEITNLTHCWTKSGASYDAFAWASPRHGDRSD